MVEYVKDLQGLVKGIGPIILISDEQTDENARIVQEPVIVFGAGGERIGYIPLENLREWIDSKMPSGITKALIKEGGREQEFGISDYGREYLVDQGYGSRSVRYSAWRVDRPNVRGYGKTPNEAIYDLTRNVQPL